MQANWWVSTANNGHCNKRIILKGGINGTKMTRSELKDDAMKIAQNHMQLYMDCAETYQKREFN